MNTMLFDKAPSVSVIVPNYNHAHFLTERLDSIINQSVEDFEIILLDDCSTDESVHLLSKYSKHPKVTHFEVNDENSGSPFSQWQKGINLARGEFVWIAESDDTADANLLKNLLKPLQSHPQCVVSSCASKLIDESGNQLTTHTQWQLDIDPDRWQEPFINRGDAEINSFLAFRNTIPNASAVLFRTEVARKLNLPVRFRYAGDWLFWIRILQHGDYAYCPSPYNFFRLHNSTTRSRKDVRSELVRIQEFREAVREAGTQLNFQRQPDHRDHSWMLKGLKGCEFRMISSLLLPPDIDLAAAAGLIWQMCSTCLRQLTRRCSTAFGVSRSK